MIYIHYLMIILSKIKISAGVMLNISEIEPRNNQPRKNFDRESIESLADSIANCGVLQPIIVHENLAFPGTYEIIAGERRWRAARMAGLSEIPAIVLTGDELQMAQVSLVENLQREDLNPVEEAWAYMDLIERFGLTQEQVASKVGKSRSAVTNTLRLLDLPEEVLELLRSGELSAGHARALLGLSDKKSMVSVAEKIIQKQLSVREVELLIKKMNSLFAFPDNQDDDEKYILEGLSQRKVYMKELERKVMQALGRRVKISCSPRKVLELSYENDEDLESLLTLLCGESLFASDTIL